MVRDSLPLLIALLLPLAGAAGWPPVGGVEGRRVLPTNLGPSAGDAAVRTILLPIPAHAPLPVAGVWLNF